MAKTITFEDVICPECGYEFETSKKKDIQCSQCAKNGKGTRFDL
jgi:hypothetical protein